MALKKATDPLINSLSTARVMGRTSFAKSERVERSVLSLIVFCCASPFALAIMAIMSLELTALNILLASIPILTVAFYVGRSAKRFQYITEATRIMSEHTDGKIAWRKARKTPDGRTIIPFKGENSGKRNPLYLVLKENSLTIMKVKSGTELWDDSLTAVTNEYKAGRA